MMIKRTAGTRGKEEDGGKEEQWSNEGYFQQKQFRFGKWDVDRAYLSINSLLLKYIRYLATEKRRYLAQK